VSDLRVLSIYLGLPAPPVPGLASPEVVHARQERQEQDLLILVAGGRVATAGSWNSTLQYLCAIRSYRGRGTVLSPPLGPDFPEALLQPTGVLSSQ
jgi:hypothetical protein